MKFTIGLILVFFSVFLVAGIFIFLNSKPDELTDKQKEEMIADMLGRKANTDPDIKTGNVAYKGKYGEFSYPEAAQIYEYEKLQAKKSENEDFFSFDMQNPRLVFNYSASNTNETDLASLPSVKLRQDKSRGYNEEKEKVDGVSGLVFSKERSGEYMAEKSVFAINNGKIYTISITGASLEDIQKLYLQILKSFKFI